MADDVEASSTASATTAATAAADDDAATAAAVEDASKPEDLIVNFIVHPQSQAKPALQRFQLYVAEDATGADVKKKLKQDVGYVLHGFLCWTCGGWSVLMICRSCVACPLGTLRGGCNWCTLAASSPTTSQSRRSA